MINTALSFDALAAAWKDTPQSHEKVYQDFNAAILACPRLYEHRKWIVENRWGCGCDAFHAVWHLLAKELPDGFKAIEIGVYRGQSISAIDLAAQIENKSCTIYGLSPFNGADGNYYEHRDNYQEDVEQLFARFNGNRRPVLIKGYSTDEEAKSTAAAIAPFDIVYVDACHTDPHATHDVEFYTPLTKVGGYVVFDDATVGFNVPAYFFQGFADITEACNKYFVGNSKYKFIGNVMHLRIYQRLEQ